VGRDVRDLEATRGLILDALTWGLALTAGLALVGGWLMTSRVVRRIEAINQTSRDIMEGDLSRRIPLGGSGDDFDQLADGLNRMLSRIETLMAGVRQVSDNIAHDLRTPLTRLRTKLEVLRAELESALGDGHPTSAAVEETIADADVMLTTFNALLRIARIESGSQRAGFAEVDLAPLAQDVAELYEPVAADKDQTLLVEVPRSALVIGDRDLLFQALGNLVDNAVKYTPEGGRVTLRIRPLADTIAVEVTDSGPGIPPELRGEVFRRFFRADHSRSTPGSGLGLSLVQAVIQLHGASIELGDNGPGLRVTVRVPRPKPSAQVSNQAAAMS
jgi:signal transduction histidine kinase